MIDAVEKIIHSRSQPPALETIRKAESEGGCGVIGFASDKKLAAKHLIPPLCQMNNRGNGKGGGVAGAGFDPEMFKVSQEILDKDYLLAISYLDPQVKDDLYQNWILTLFEVDQVAALPFKNVPEAILYFVRVKKERLARYRHEIGEQNLPDEVLEDELVFQNSNSINQKYYTAESEKKAFVLSHGKNLLILKCVGYGQDVVRGYEIEELKAHIWIGHHRYPTKGRVWHPGGAHPFAGLHEALVHNGDFANYHSICEYLSQRNIYPHFLTDTEVSVLLFDLLSRTYQYPLEYVMEAIAPTTERDFFLLPKEKQRIYKQIQQTHLPASPDGPWFFIIAQSRFPQFRLIGITDTSMLRPQVFATQMGENSIGIIASEKQAIDSVLESLSAQDGAFWPKADHYWSCRGGSATDGGAFVFTLEQKGEGKPLFSCTDKFGRSFRPSSTPPPIHWKPLPPAISNFKIPDYPPQELFLWVRSQVREWGYEEATAFLHALEKSVSMPGGEERAFYILARLLDLVLPLKKMRRSFFLALVEASVTSLVQSAPPHHEGKLAVIDAARFESEGENSLSREIVKRYREGVKKFVIGNCKGHRFIGCGLGPRSHGVEMDIFGSAGDYLGSGIDGAQIRLHGNGQDQLGQILKEGKLVIFGDVGQTLMYGAKGGSVFVRGSAAGRPLINAVGSCKLILNGTSLDYFAESFMAGDPLKGGGFAIINRVAFNEEGEIVDLKTPYPGSNLLSLASGGAIYVRDPERSLSLEQLNGGEFAEFTSLDQNLITPYLEENAHLFDIPVSRLLEVRGQQLTLSEVYRKIVPAKTHFMDPETDWVNLENPN